MKEFNHSREEIFYDWSLWENNLRLGVCSRDKIHDEDIATLSYLDIELYTYIIMGEDEDETLAVEVSYDLISYWDKTLEKIFQIAIKNMEYEVYFRNDNSNYALITTPNLIDGASALFIKPLLYKLATYLEDDLVISATTVNELIICPISEYSEDRLYEILDEIQETSSEEEDDEALSDHVYYYSRATNDITWDE